MAKKPQKRSEYKEAIYDEEHWILLGRLRQKAAHLMQTLAKSHLESTVHGSIARGDVNMKSDIDIFLPAKTSSFIVENALEKTDFSISRRFIIQATPTYAMKAHIEIDEKTTVSFPLMNMRKVEREFYKFGGEIGLEDLKHNRRVIGVDKRLMLIEPTSLGHKESTIVGQEDNVANMLGISVETVSDRVRTLIRRDKIGRTGVFIKAEVGETQSFEMVLKRLVNQNPAVRRRLLRSS